tara:strand:+ start:32877 stop:33392 length:516 start_codon:yes stop_codon:yes gene_type:complete
MFFGNIITKSIIRSFVMNKNIFLFICFIFSGLLLNAQTFSKSEQKVIDAVNNYWKISAGKNKEAWKDVFHKSYKGWNKNNKALSNKAMITKWIDYNWGKNEVLYWDINPIGVQIYDDVAIVHYYYSMVTKNKQTDKTTNSDGRWTDILLNEKGNWKLVSDHGGKEESKTNE